MSGLFVPKRIVLGPLGVVLPSFQPSLCSFSYPFPSPHLPNTLLS